MFCTSCGKKIRDDSKFCPHCGASIESAGTAPAETAGDPLPVQPVEMPQAVPDTVVLDSVQPDMTGGPILTGGKKHRGLGLLAAAAVVCVVLVALIGVLLGGALGGAKGKVEKAVTKSLGAYSSAADSVGIPDLSSLLESKEVSRTFSLSLKDLGSGLGYSYSDLELLEGAGVRMSTATSLSKKDIGASIALSYGSADLLTAYLNVNNDTMTLYSPEFMGDTALGINTVTLGEDLKNLDVDGFEDTSFNIFDILNAYAQPIEMDKSANKALVKAIEVEKVGKSSMDINEYTVDCVEYHVTIPEDAMKEWLDAAEDAMKARELDDVTIDMLRSLGIPEDEISDMKSDIKDAFNGSSAFDELKDAVKALGDLELDVYLDGGYVMAVVWEGRIDGNKTEIGLYLGGGKNYVDDLSVVIEAAGGEVRFASNGDHAAKSGAFTDNSTLRYEDDWSSYKFESEMEYAPKSKTDNFSWTIKGSDFTVKAEGQLTSGKDSLDLQLEDISLKAYGSELFSLEAGYSIAPYAKQDFPAKETMMLSAMDEDDLLDLADDIESNAEDWLMDLLDEIPELYSLLWYF